MDFSLYITTFVLGFAGSLHCLGMCGPLQSFLVKMSWDKKLLYHYGRFIAYAFIGILFFLVGYSSQLVSFQKQLTILTGVLLILSVFITLEIFEKFFPKISSFIFKRIQTDHALVKVFFMGLANGLLPCGLVYVIASQCVSDSSILISLSKIFIFVLGTLPALLGINYVYGYLNKGKFYFKFLKPTLTLCIGCLLILRGYFDINTHKQNSSSQSCVSIKKI